MRLRQMRTGKGGTSTSWDAWRRTPRTGPRANGASDALARAAGRRRARARARLARRVGGGGDARVQSSRRQRAEDGEGELALLGGARRRDATSFSGSTRAKADEALEDTELLNVTKSGIRDDVPERSRARSRRKSSRRPAAATLKELVCAIMAFNRDAARELGAMAPLVAMVASDQSRRRRRAIAHAGSRLDRLEASALHQARIRVAIDAAGRCGLAYANAANRAAAIAAGRGGGAGSRDARRAARGGAGRAAEATRLRLGERAGEPEAAGTRGSVTIRLSRLFLYGDMSWMGCKYLARGYEWANAPIG